MDCCSDHTLRAARSLLTPPCVTRAGDSLQTGRAAAPARGRGSCPWRTAPRGTCQVAECRERLAQPPAAPTMFSGQRWPGASRESGGERRTLKRDFLWEGEPTLKPSGSGRPAGPAQGPRPKLRPCTEAPGRPATVHAVGLPARDRTQQPELQLPPSREAPRLLMPGIVDGRRRSPPTPRAGILNSEVSGGKTSSGLYYITSGQIKQSPRNRSSRPPPLEGTHQRQPWPAPQSSRQPQATRPSLGPGSPTSPARTLVSVPLRPPAAPGPLPSQEGRAATHTKCAAACCPPLSMQGRGSEQGQGPHPPTAGTSKVGQRGLCMATRAGLPRQPWADRPTAALSFLLETPGQENAQAKPRARPSGTGCGPPASPGATVPHPLPQPACTSATSPPPTSLQHLRASNLPGAQDEPSARNPGAAGGRLSQLQLPPACSPVLPAPRRNHPASQPPPLRNEGLRPSLQYDHVLKCVPCTQRNPGVIELPSAGGAGGTPSR